MSTNHLQSQVHLSRWKRNSKGNKTHQLKIANSVFWQSLNCRSQQEQGAEDYRPVALEFGMSTLRQDVMTNFPYYFDKFSKSVRTQSNLYV